MTEPNTSKKQNRKSLLNLDEEEEVDNVTLPANFNYNHETIETMLKDQYGDILSAENALPIDRSEVQSIKKLNQSWANANLMRLHLWFPLMVKKMIGFITGEIKLSSQQVRLLEKYIDKLTPTHVVTTEDEVGNVSQSFEKMIENKNKETGATITTKKTKKKTKKK